MMAVDFEADPMEWRPSAIAETDPGELLGLTSDELVGLSPWALRAYAERIGKENAVEFLDYLQAYEERGEATEADNRVFWPLNDAIFGHRATHYKPSLDYSAADLVRWAADRTHLAWHNQIGDDIALADALAAAYSDLAERIGDPLGHLAAACKLMEKITLSILRERRVADDEAPADDGDSRPASADFSELDGIDAGMASLQETAPRFPLLSAADLLALPPMRWRVRGILPTDGLAALYGPPGCGKSFLAIDMLAAIAEGRPWFDYATTAAPCVYVGLEGEAGVAQRVQAYCTKRTAPDRLRVVLTPLDLRRPDDREELAAAIREASMGEGVVAIDTLNRAAPGIDENDASSMGLLIDAAKDLRERVGGLVLLIHHAGKDITRGLRGHSSLLAALDCVLEVTREGDRRAWQLAKAKDAGDDESSPFRLDVVELGTDADGWPVSSCVVEPEAPAGESVRNSKLPKGGNQRIVWEAIGELLRDSKTFGQGGAPTMRPCIRLDDAIEKTRDRLACESNRRTPRTREAITGLVNRGLLELREDWLWCK
jgi:hypothetical protein